MLIPLISCVSITAFQAKVFSLPVLSSKKRLSPPASCFIDPIFCGQENQPPLIAKARLQALLNADSIPRKAPKHIGPSMGKLPQLRICNPSLICIESLNDTECLDLLYSLFYTIYLVRKNYDPAQAEPLQKPNLSDTLRISGTQITMKSILEAVQRILQHSPNCSQYVCSGTLFGISTLDLLAGQGHYAALKDDLEGLSLVCDILNSCSLEVIIYKPSYESSLKKLAQKFCTEHLCVKNRIRIPVQEQDLFVQLDCLLKNTLITLYPKARPAPLKEDDLNLLLHILDTLVLRFIYLQQLSQNTTLILSLLAPYRINKQVSQHLKELENYLQGNMATKMMPHKNGDIIQNFQFFDNQLKLKNQLQQTIDPEKQ